MTLQSCGFVRSRDKLDILYLHLVTYCEELPPKNSHDSSMNCLVRSRDKIKYISPLGEDLGHQSRRNGNLPGEALTIKTI